jgi:hypothetical protein
VSRALDGAALGPDGEVGLDIAGDEAEDRPRSSETGMKPTLPGGYPAFCMAFADATVDDPRLYTVDDSRGFCSLSV